ncbi:small integral membrane protein 24 [Cavia porcellus]|uniref:small integral membrane protein 24 n=1 Tax=Cavia porcellus TaxID=10141 RepID=UPI002FE016A5
MQGHLGGRGPQGTLRPLVSRLQGEAQGRAESRGVNVTPGPESAGGRGRPACSASAPLIPAGARACSHLSLEAMNALGTLLALAALFLPSVQAQEERHMKPWLVGLTAVVVFLFIVFVLLLANRVWCSKARTEDEETMERIQPNPYENVGPRKESKAGKKELSGESNAGLELGEAGQADGYQEMKTSM